MSITIKGNVELRFCDDCGTSHLGVVPCGMSYAQRLRTTRLASEWMPAKTDSRQRGDSVYYDDEALSGMFGDGLTGKEREEQMMEETQGVGIAYAEDIEKYPELVDAHYLTDPAANIEDDDG